MGLQKIIWRLGRPCGDLEVKIVFLNKNDYSNQLIRLIEISFVIWTEIIAKKNRKERNGFR